MPDLHDPGYRRDLLRMGKVIVKDKPAAMRMNDFEDRIKWLKFEIERRDSRILQLEKMLMRHIYALDDRLLELEHGKQPPTGGVCQ